MGNVIPIFSDTDPSFVHQTEPAALPSCRGDCGQGRLECESRVCYVRPRAAVVGLVAMIASALSVLAVIGVVLWG